ncbi:MAG: cell wall hydrolase [Bacteroidota bacterium]
MKRIRLLSLLLLVTICAFAVWMARPNAQPVQAGGWYYYVQPGDTLFIIARKVGLPLNQLRTANGLWTDSIRPNQRIFIPTATTPTTQSYSRGGNDTELLAMLIMAESGNEPYIGQVAAGAVVLNRVESPLFPNSIAGVIYEPDAFESVSNGHIYSQPPSNSARQAAESALSGWDPSGGALFFFNPAKTSSPFIWSRQIITQIGSHIFSR